jgi:hypothetical protein
MDGLASARQTGAPGHAQPNPRRNETLGNGGRPASFRPLMKRFLYCLSAIALTVGFNACEGHSDGELPEHYQKRIDTNTPTHEGGEGAKHEGGEKAAGEHPKPAEGEPKAR